MFSLTNFAFADNVEQKNYSLKIYLSSVIEVLYNKKQKNPTYYTDIDNALREYLKNDEGIDSLSKDCDKVNLLIDENSIIANKLKENNIVLENLRKEILNLKSWNEADRNLILNKIRDNADSTVVKAELENLIKKYNDTNINNVDNNKTTNNGNIEFKDIKDHWAKDYIVFMVNNKITNGYSDSTFKPENKITRAEFCKMLVESLKLNKVVYNNSFTDIKNHWAKDYIQTAYNAGLIKGYDDIFKPNENITRAEMATMIGRTLNNNEKSDLKIFKDYNKIPSWSKEYVAKSVFQNLIKGDNNLFRPNDNTTRAEAITILYRSINK